MNDSKIRLSAKEMLLVQDSNWILTKLGIINKVYELFGSLSAQMQASLQPLQHVLPAEALPSMPKISKGEQYERLPYVVLDYPRVFSKEDVFAIRTFFWWGNYFSCTLHLKGKFVQQYHHNIRRALQRQGWAGYYLSVQGNEFNFDLDHKDYIMIENNSDQELLNDISFVKISYKHSFTHWNSASEKLMEAFGKLIAVIAH